MQLTKLFDAQTTVGLLFNQRHPLFNAAPRVAFDRCCFHLPGSLVDKLGSVNNLITNEYNGLV